MKQYLEEFNLEIEDMKSVSCNQPFVFGPSKRYVSTSLVELPILITRLDGKEDVLIVQTYLVDAEVPFLCGKQTLETWNFKIEGQEKILDKKLMEEKKMALNDSLVKAAAWTHNTSGNKLGYTPLQLVTGKAVTLPGLTTVNESTESMTDCEAV